MPLRSSASGSLARRQPATTVLGQSAHRPRRSGAAARVRAAFWALRVVNAAARS